MKRARLFVMLASLAFAGDRAADAHHSLAGVYEQSGRMTLEGTITQFQFVNPHPFFMMDVTDASGATQSWKAELDNRVELVDAGVTPTTFKAGDRVVVTGSPGRFQKPLIYVRRLVRSADGFLYEEVGNSPRLSRLRR